MKKVILFVMLLCALAFAQTNAVVVTGSGASEEEARNNAFVMAIEQAIGVMVSSDVIIRNGELINEKIITHSDGFIESYSTLSSGNADGVHYITIRAIVSQAALSKELEIITGTKIDIDGASTAANISTKQKLYNDRIEAFKDNRANELLNSLRDSIDVTITGISFNHEQASAESVPFDISVDITINREKYIEAIAEIDKEFVALGAERIASNLKQEPAQRLTAAEQLRLENSRAFSMQDDNDGGRLLIEAYDELKPKKRASQSFIDNVAANVPKKDLTTYKFSDTTFEIVNEYFLQRLSAQWVGLLILFISNDDSYHYVPTPPEVLAFGYNPDDSSPTLAPVFRQRRAERTWTIQFRGDVPISVVENMKTIATRIN